MTVISRQQELINQRLSQGASYDFGLADGAGAAFEEAWNTGPTAAISRGFKSMFDSSEKVEALTANEKYGLAGTDAAFKEGEEVTEDRAKAVSDDYYRRILNDTIQEVVNDESPISGRITQFASSLAAGFADPVMLAANVGGAALIGAGGRALLANRAAFNTVAKYSPSAGKLIDAAYSANVTRTLTQVVAREGMENVVGGVLEESIIRAFDVGQERLAVKTDWQDSMLNITAGTVFGTVLSTGISRDGRKALSKSFRRRYGDGAADAIHADLKMADLESRLGVERSKFDMRMQDVESFDFKPWHGTEYKYDAANTGVPTKLFVSVDENGVMFRPRHLDGGLVLHDNINMAYNNGTKVMEYDPSNMRIMNRDVMVDAKGRHTKTGAAYVTDVADDLARNVDNAKLSNAIAHMKGEVKGEVKTLNRNQIRAELKTIMKGMDVDQIDEVITAKLNVLGQMDYEPNTALNTFLDKNNWNGYMFSGKNNMGDNAYKGVYIAENSQKKLVKSMDLETPKPEAGDKIKFDSQKAQMMSDYHDYIGNKAKPIRKSNADLAGAPEKTVDETVPVSKNEHVDAMYNTKEKMDEVTGIRAEMQERLEANPEDGDLKQALKTIDEILANKEKGVIVDEQFKKIQEYDACMLGG